MRDEFPQNDDEFIEYVLEGVEPSKSGGYSLSFDGCLACHSGDNNPIEPKVGMVMRQYGKGFGSPFRGIYIDGVKFFYRTPAEDKEYRDVQAYGADAADWLKRWDDGRSVWSIEMGGLGPGYEQAIQITVAEILRHLLDAKYDHKVWADQDAWKRDREKIDAAGFANERIKQLGLSGAQWGAAMSLATSLYMNGPRHIMTDERVKDRHIQVSRTFPQAA